MLNRYVLMLNKYVLFHKISRSVKVHPDLDVVIVQGQQQCARDTVLAGAVRQSFMRVHHAQQSGENIHGTAEQDVAAVRLATVTLEAKEQPKHSERVKNEPPLNAEML